MIRWLKSLWPILLIPAASHGNQLAISFGPSLDGGTNPKYAALGYEFLGAMSSLLGECGGMFESQTNEVCMIVLSARVQTPAGLFTRVGVGPAVVFHTDDRLSSVGEFSLQGMVGLAQGGWDIGAKFQHFSNAGIVPPNLGRDFILACVEIGL